MLVIVNRRARECRHRLTLRSADQHANFFRGEVLHLARVNDQAFRDFNVAEVLCDFGGVVHRSSDESDFAPVLVREFDGEIDAVNRTGEAGDEKTALGVGENFVELATHGAFAGRISLALHVCGILKEGEHAFLAVFRERMKIEQFVVGGCRIDFEVARVNDDAERRVDGERDAIHQTVRDADRVNGENSSFEALIGADLA